MTKRLGNICVSAYLFGKCLIQSYMTVWAITELMLGEEEHEVIVVYDAMKEFGLIGLEL